MMNQSPLLFLCNKIHEFLNQFSIVWLAISFTNYIVSVFPAPGTPVDELKSLFRMVPDPNWFHKSPAGIFSVSRDFTIYVKGKQAKGAVVSVAAVWYGQYLSFTVLTDKCRVQLSLTHEKSPPFPKKRRRFSYEPSTTSRILNPMQPPFFYILISLNPLIFHTHHSLSFPSFYWLTGFILLIRQKYW